MPIELNESMDYELARWPAHQSPPLTCPACKKLWPLAKVMCIYQHREWLGVTLEGQYFAMAVLSQIAQWIEDHSAPDAGYPQTIRVFDSMDDLSYVIRHPDCSVYRIDLKGCVTPYWEEEVLAIIQVADSALEQNLGALAYMIIAGIVQENTNFFFIPRIRDALEVAAQASGEASLSEDNHWTALQDYEETVAALDAYRPAAELDGYTVWHDIPCDVTTNKPSDGHVNNIIQQSPSRLEAGKMWLRILTAGLMLQRRTQAKGPPSRWVTERRLKTAWQQFTKSERQSLATHFHDISGLSIKKIFGLEVG